MPGFAVVFAVPKRNRGLVRFCSDHAGERQEPAKESATFCVRKKPAAGAPSGRSSDTFCININSLLSTLEMIFQPLTDVPVASML
jgi:hypothetical protein